MVMTGRPRRGPLWFAVLPAIVMMAGACSPGSTTPPTGTAVTTAASTQVGTAGPSSTASEPPPPLTVTPTPQPTFPAAVSLSWLDGVGTAPAIRVRSDSLVRWQGSVPGEHAELLPDGAYRWVGTDGSMVGCAMSPRPASGVVTHLRCIGIDTAGDTAVTSDAGGRRVVFGPGGRLLGEFSADGTRVTSGRPVVTMAQAVEASGVDVASLVDFATRSAPFAGGVTGDPHLITIGGTRVSTQQTGDFLARAGDPAHQIQLRLEPMPFQTDVSYVTTVALAMQDPPGGRLHRLQFSLAGALSVDGAPVTSAGQFRQISVGDGPEVGLWPADADGIIRLVVLWSDGSSISMAADPSLGLTVIADLPVAAVGGLFGTVRGTGGAEDGGATPAPNDPAASPSPSSGDFVDRASGAGSSSAGSSSSGSSGSVERVVGSWRVAPGESLFDDAPGPLPQSPDSSAQISPAAGLAAQKACESGSLVVPGDVAACVFDVARTGDDGYVVHHTELADAATPPVVPVALASGWPALELGAALSPENVSPDNLDLGAQIDRIVPSGTRRVYRLSLDASSGLLVTGADCPAHRAGDEAPRGAAALRLFDSSGHPVSHRRSPCGTGSTGVLAAGTYYLVLAGPNSGGDARFKVRVSVG